MDIVYNAEFVVSRTFPLAGALRDARECAAMERNA